MSSDRSVALDQEFQSAEVLASLTATAEDELDRLSSAASLPLPKPAKSCRAKHRSNLLDAFPPMDNCGAAAQELVGFGPVVRWQNSAIAINLGSG